MPKILERLVHQLTAKHVANAYAVATAHLIKTGILTHHLKLTAKGEKRNAMTPAQRAKDRAAKQGNHKPSDFKYNAKTNRATLKKKHK